MFSFKNPELVHKAYLKKIVLPEYPFLSFVKQIFIVHQNVFENHMIFCLLCLPFQFQSFNTIWTFLSPKKHCFKSIILSLCLNVSFQIGACGSAETAFAALSLKEGIIPATLVLESQNVGLRIFLFQRLKGKLVPERPRSK